MAKLDQNVAKINYDLALTRKCVKNQLHINLENMKQKLELMNSN